MRVQDGGCAPFTTRASFFELGSKAKRGPVAALAMALAAFAAPAVSAPTYQLKTFIPIPASPANLASTNSVAGSFNSYDIMWFDGNSQLLYLADRSNASVDIFNAATNTFFGRIGGSADPAQKQFVGFSGVTATSGPNGVVIGDSGGAGPGNTHNLYAGDGNSTLRGYNIGTTTATLNAAIANPNGALLPNMPYATGTPANNRVDEMAFGRLDANTSRLLVANNAASPSFVSLIDTSNNNNTSPPLRKLVTGADLPTAGGIEQSVYDPASKAFYLNVQSANAGSVVKIDAATGNVLHTYFLSAIDPTVTSCAPTGLALGSGGKLLVGCDVGQTILLDPNANGGNGSLKKVPITGEDMVWFDPTRNLYFTASRNNPGGPELGVIDDIGQLIQVLSTSAGAHSVAVDPVSGEVFVPYGGFGSGGVTTNACPGGPTAAGNPLGCIAVFIAVPEPGSLALLSSGLIMIGVLAWRRRRALSCVQSAAFA